VETQLGRFAAELERPEPIKFAWPIVVLPELFTTTTHLAILIGYLSSVGWEVYAPNLRAQATAPALRSQAVAPNLRTEPVAPDPRTQAGAGATPPLGLLGFGNLVALATEALAALSRDAIVLGHGIGGLVALKLAEQPNVKAAVAYAPLIPGFRTPLIGGVGNRIRMWRRRPLLPPTGRMLFEFVADADLFTRERAITAMVPDAAVATRDVMRGEISFAAAANAAPRLVVAGEADIFAPFDRMTVFANSLGAPLAKIASRGHWLIGGRALERAIGETQRFLVRALGQDLLLLYPEEWKNE
jgi:pimeloyl-ACP methyl ester carboxylesterase